MKLKYKVIRMKPRLTFGKAALHAFLMLAIVTCLASLASLIGRNPAAASEPTQSLAVIRLQAPWSENEYAGLRYPQTYCRSSEWGDCEKDGHHGIGVWNGADFWARRSGGGTVGGWKVLAAHSGTVSIQTFDCLGGSAPGINPPIAVLVTNTSLGIRTGYGHLRLQENLREGQTVNAGQVIGYVPAGTEEDPLDCNSGYPHMMLTVFRFSDGDWQRVDLHNVELDGQRVFSPPYPRDEVNKNGTRIIQDDPIASYSGLTQIEAGATNEANDQFGHSVAIGDFNGDGKDDLAVGTPNEDDDATDDGMVVVYYGSVLGITPGVERLGQKHTDARSENDDRFGSTLAVGDFNGDGKDDLAVGVPGENDEAIDDGMVIVFYGSANGLISSVNGRFRAVKYERLGQKHADARSESEDCFGSTLTAGDFNGDGKDDLAVGVPGENDEATNDGMVVVFYGSSSGLLQQEGGQWRAIAYERLGQKQVGAVSESYDRFGSALASGDFNCDGRDELVIGVPGEDDEATDDGMAVVFYGSQYGLLRKVNDQWRAVRYERLGQKQVDAFSESNDRFGYALTAGDFNKDGRDDLAAGVPGENDQATNDGMVVVFYGTSYGLLRQVNGQWRAAAYERLSQKHADARSENGDQFGLALTAGDFNGDGKDDLGVGVPFENDDADDDGLVVVFYGSSSGLLLQENGQWRAARFERLGQKRAGGKNEAGDHFGWALASGDFDGDGKDDLAIGAPDENVAGKQDAGTVYIYTGSANGLIP